MMQDQHGWESTKLVELLLQKQWLIIMLEDMVFDCPHFRMHQTNCLKNGQAHLGINLWYTMPC
jgi:hypothetical protein